MQLRLHEGTRPGTNEYDPGRPRSHRAGRPTERWSRNFPLLYRSLGARANCVQSYPPGTRDQEGHHRTARQLSKSPSRRGATPVRHGHDPHAVLCSLPARLPTAAQGKRLKLACRGRPGLMHASVAWSWPATGRTYVHACWCLVSNTNIPAGVQTYVLQQVGRVSLLPHLDTIYSMHVKKKWCASCM